MGTKVMRDVYYLDHVVSGLPIDFVLDGRSLKAKFEVYRKKGIVRVSVGPTEAKVTLKIKRPYTTHN